MARSRLRIAIGAAVVAGTALVVAGWVAGRSAPAPAPSSTSTSTSTSTSVSAPGASTPRTTDAPSATVSGESATASSEPRPDVPLDQAIAEAYEIRSSGRRDDALSRLVDIGLAQRDHPAALQAAAGVSDFTRRDALLDRVSCRAMRAGDEATVRKATTRAFSPALREEISQRLAAMTAAAGASGARAGLCTGPD